MSFKYYVRTFTLTMLLLQYYMLYFNITYIYNLLIFYTFFYFYPPPKVQTDFVDAIFRCKKYTRRRVSVVAKYRFLTGHVKNVVLPNSAKQVLPFYMLHIYVKISLIRQCQNG